MVSEPKPAKALLRRAALLVFSAAASLHAVQLLGVTPQHFPANELSVWPHPFHFWLLESLLAIAGVALLVLRARWLALQTWWASAGPTKQALALVAPLFAIQALIGLGFWFTRNQTVDDLGWLRATFWLSAEYRPPAFFAAFQLGLAAWLCWRVRALERRSPWGAAAAICLYMGIDEGLGIHEQVGHRIAAFSDAPAFEGVYNWMVFFAPLALALGLWLAWRFAKVLDRLAMGLLILAGAMFLSGAVGFELLESTGSSIDKTYQATPAGQLNLLLEEMLEFSAVGLAVFVFARHWLSLGGAVRSAAARPQERPSEVPPRS
jgi:hypothetical protein